MPLVYAFEAVMVLAAAPLPMEAMCMFVLENDEGGLVPSSRHDGSESSLLVGNS